MSDTETIEREEVETESTAVEPGQYKVLIHNDRTTTYDFVISLLGSVFHKTYDEAYEIALLVDNDGIGIAGIFTQEVAEAKTEEALMLAAQAGYPLLTTFEEV